MAAPRWRRGVVVSANESRFQAAAAAGPRTGAQAGGGAWYVPSSSRMWRRSLAKWSTSVAAATTRTRGRYSKGTRAAGPRAAST